MTFFLRTAFAVLGVVVFSFSFVLRCHLISSMIFLLTHSSFSTILLILHIIMWFSIFFWCLISCNIPLWSEIVDMISILLNLLGLVLCPNTWSILENIPHALVKYVYSAALGWNALKIPIKSIWFSVSFKATIFLLVFLLEDLCIDVNGVLKYPTVTVSQFLPLCPSRFVVYI